MPITLVVGILLSGFPLTAISQSDDIATLSGTWSFQTETYWMGACQMSGSLTVMRSDNDSSASCILTARETCEGDQSIVEQTCQIRLSPDGAAISSSIENIIQLDPKFSGYLPDNFRLPMVSSDEMSGRLDSSQTPKVLFWRSEGAIS